MCEQTPLSYNDGDIVWVKLGPCWWPGEVHDLNKLPEEWLQDFRKRPITAVKFFEEDAYEYVKSFDKIYSYNCTKKHEFIKKGLDLCKGNNPVMDKFPSDVATAEKRTNGDPDILNSPLFKSPEKKQNFAALLFGSQKLKKQPKKWSGGRRSSSSVSSPSSSTKSSTNKLITHPRFLGHGDDHEVRILLPTDKTDDSTSVPAESLYNCSSCGYTTSRIDVIISHNKSHIMGNYNSPISKKTSNKKVTEKKGRKPKTNTTLHTESSGDEDGEEPKRKRKRNKKKPKQPVTETKKQEQPTVDIRDHLLAEWEDETDNEEATEEDGTLNTSSVMESDASLINNEAPSNLNDKPAAETKKDSAKSCFDFEEEEESNDKIIETTAGRKIPRVIPHCEKQKVVDPDVAEANLPDAEDDIVRNEQISMDNEEVDVAELKSNSDEFEKILDATSVPDLPEIPHPLKYEQNFHTARTVKFPDKSDSIIPSSTDSSETKETEDLSPKLINPKKRFVKSFEDFEQQWNEQRKLAEVQEQSNNSLNKNSDEKQLQIDEVAPVHDVSDNADKLIVVSKPTDNQVTVSSTVDDQMSISETKHHEILDLETTNNQISVAEITDCQIPLMVDVHDDQMSISKTKDDQISVGETTDYHISPLKTTDTQVSTPKTTDVEVSTPKTTDVEVSTPKTTDVEVSTPKTTDAEVSAPKSTDTEVSAHKTTDTEVCASKTTTDTEVSAYKTTDNQESILESTDNQICGFETTDNQLNIEQEPDIVDEQSKSNSVPETDSATPILSDLDDNLKSLSEDDSNLKLNENNVVEMDILHGLIEVQQSRVQNDDDLSSESIKEMEKTATSVVEVSKLKTQLMFKLESGEKLEQSKMKSFELPKVRSFRERTKSKEDKKSNEAKSNQSPKQRTTPADETKKEEKSQKRSDDKVGRTKTALSPRISTRVRRSSLKVLESFEFDQGAEMLDLEEIPSLMVKKAEVKQHSAAPETEEIGPHVDNESLNNQSTHPEVVQMETHLDYSEIYPEHNNEETLELPVSVDAIVEKSALMEEEVVEMEAPAHDNLDIMQTTVGMEETDKTNGILEINRDEFISLPLETSPSFHEYLNANTTSTEASIYRGTESEDLSGLTTLAVVSELTTSFDIKHKTVEENLSACFDVTPRTSEKTKAIEGSLKIVTEDELAEGQVEIANISDSDVDHAKPVTLSNFSVDFTAPNTHNSDVQKTVTEPTAQSVVRKINKRKYSADANQNAFEPTTSSDSTQKLKSMKLMSVVKEKVVDMQNCDIEDQIPSLIVCNSKQPTKMKPNQESTNPSKLLTILTDAKSNSTKSAISPKVPNKPFTVSQKIDAKLLTSKDALIGTKVVSKFDSKNSKFIIKSATPGKSNVLKSNKPIILSETIIKPDCETQSVSVQKITKRGNDFDDIATFIIQKPTKKIHLAHENESETVAKNQPTINRASLLGVKKSGTLRGGKAKILQQTIIKPATSESASATTTVSQLAIDDNMFDINSMPIVLGDQIISAENIDNLPSVVLADSPKSIPPSTKVQNEPPMKLLNKTPTLATQPMLVKTYSSQKLTKSPRIYQTTPKPTKTNLPVITRAGKSDKYIIVPSTAASSPLVGTKYTVAPKKPPQLVKKGPTIQPTPVKLQSTAASSSESSGNKIMIVTNQQGQQSRVLLTPAHQKLLGVQSTGTSKFVKNTLKGNILQKATNKPIGISPITSTKLPTNMISHAIVNSKGEIITTTTQSVFTSESHMLMPVKSSQTRTTIVSSSPKGGRKIQMQSQKVLLQEGLNALKGSSIPGQQKTIVIKNQQGQIVKKFHGTDDTLLEQQVAEQVQAIKASGSFSALKAKQEAIKAKTPIRRSYPRKSIAMESTIRSIAKPQMILNTTPKTQKTESALPPLAPISPKRPEPLLNPVKMEDPQTVEAVTKPLNQLIIQDALGNQTTITEGQILALPSGETIDGQPQSYMLVTLDESGNFAPLNNEALLSLDPNLSLGGDLSNMVLQIDEGGVTAQKAPSTTTAEISKSPTKNNSEPKQTLALQEPESLELDKAPPESSLILPIPADEEAEEKSLNEVSTDSAFLTSSEPSEAQTTLDNVQTVTCSIGSDPNQQLIITGDPITTQKFIQSLTEGNPDLANLLAQAEGNILIQTDEQQILINTDGDNQVLLPLSSDNLDGVENSEGDGNPIFATQPLKNQDILAAALADTDVFQQEQSMIATQPKLPHSQLSPGGLYPTSIGSNVLETTLSLSSPIMTPLEIPSGNNKKIPDEETDLILSTEVPKNLDLPITITDPNISQTVAQQQQQVASLISNELTASLALPLTITDQGVPLTSAELNSPSFVYSLPSLDESDDIHPKTFPGPISMPLLTEEPQDVALDSPSSTIDKVDETESTNENTPLDTTTMQLNSGDDNEANKLFEVTPLPPSDCIKDDEKSLETTSASFMGTSIETEEGLCTLGGAMCSSLSEPPPDMFDLRYEAGIKAHIDNDIAVESTEIASEVLQQDIPLSCELESNLEESSVNQQNPMDDYDKFEHFDVESRNEGTPSSLPLNSDSSSPAINIDENSCEIPVQPQIVTDLSSSSFDTLESTDSANFETNKRGVSEEREENEKKKVKFD